MQKIINAVALLSGLVSLSILSGGAYLYLNKDNLVESVKTEVTKAVTETVKESLPGMVNAAMPEIPNVTGNAIPTSPNLNKNLPNFTGPAIPF